MTPERWKQVDELFEAVASIPLEARAVWITEQCGSDQELASELLALVSADERSRDEDFIVDAISDAAHSLVALRDAERIGERVGAYRLVSELGHGGMGAVYLAERDDGQYEATVAIKFVRAALASPDVAVRLRAERQILANLTHPNIARLLDGGASSDGTPYLVMEYIDGLTIEAHCERENLDLEGRVRLFQKVCGAVQHAHEAGVIHRDLKPSNVLVTRDGAPKLVDFGIAKLLDPEPGSKLEKITVVRVTPAYASPEQLRAERPGFSTDVYSLGVVLYELITGRVPFEPANTSFGDLERRICEEEPPRPSAVARGGHGASRALIAGDLDNILLTALAKQPERRYSSVEELGLDLQRWLDGKPVQARPATIAYRAGKFLRRHRVAVGTAAALALIVAGFATAVTRHTRRDRLEIPARGAVLTPRLAVLPFEDSSVGQASPFLSAAVTNELLHSLAKVPQLAVIGESSSSQAQLDELGARAIGAQLGADLLLDGSVERDGERIRVRAQLVDTATGEARWSRVYESELDSLVALREKVALAIARELRLEVSAGTRQQLRERPTAHGDAYELYLRGRYEWSQRTQAGIWNAIEAFREAVAADPNFALAYAGLADAYRLLPDYGNVSGPEALGLSEAAARRAIELDDTLAEAHAALAASIVETHHDRVTAAREYRRAIELNPNEVTALRWYGLHLAGDGDFDTALAYVERARALDPLSHVAIGSVGTVHYFARRSEDAVQAFQDALSLRPNWATGHAVLGRVYLLAGRVEEAIKELERAVALSDDEANDRALLATAYAVDGRRDEARMIVVELEGEQNRFLPTAGIAGVYTALGEYELAIEWLHRALELSDTGLKYLKVDPRFDALRSDPEFTRILERVGLA